MSVVFAGPAGGNEAARSSRAGIDRLALLRVSDGANRCYVQILGRLGTKVRLAFRTSPVLEPAAEPVRCCAVAASWSCHADRPRTRSRIFRCAHLRIPLRECDARSGGSRATRARWLRAADEAQSPCAGRIGPRRKCPPERNAARCPPCLAVSRVLSAGASDGACRPRAPRRT